MARKEPSAILRTATALFPRSASKFSAEARLRSWRIFGVSNWSAMEASRRFAAAGARIRVIAASGAPLQNLSAKGELPQSRSRIWFALPSPRFASRSRSQLGSGSRSTPLLLSMQLFKHPAWTNDPNQQRVEETTIQTDNDPNGQRSERTTIRTNNDPNQT